MHTSGATRVAKGRIYAVHATRLNNGKQNGFFNNPKQRCIAGSPAHLARWTLVSAPAIVRDTKQPIRRSRGVLPGARRRNDVTRCYVSTHLRMGHCVLRREEWVEVSVLRWPTSADVQKTQNTTVLSCCVVGFLDVGTCGSRYKRDPCVTQQ